MPKYSCEHETGHVTVATVMGLRTVHGGDRATMYSDGTLTVGHTLYAAGVWLYCEDKCSLCDRTISIAPRRRSEAV